MTPEEIRQKKSQLISDRANVLHEDVIVKQQRREEIVKVEASFMEKSKKLDDRLSLINKALNLLQKECKYHRIEGFYGTCPDCDYYVPDTRRDGLRAHP